jgi:anti-anti-sigma factor
MTVRIDETMHDRTARIAVRGEVDVAAAAELRDAVLAVLARWSPAVIVLDLRWASFIDSTGLGALVAGHKAAAVSGAELRLENLSTFVHRQLWITGLLGLFGYPVPRTDMPAAI